MPRHRRTRSGQLLWAILLFLGLLAALAYAVQGMMVEFHVLSHRLALESGAQALALSGLAAGATRVRVELAEGGRLRERLLSGAASEGPVELDLASEIALLTAAYPGSTLAVTARLGAPRTLTGLAPGDGGEKARLTAGRGWDPLEARFPVTLSAEARWGDARRSLTEVREAALVDVAPGTLGKFTLWARALSPAGADGFAGGFDGQPVGAGRPLVLHNGGAAPEEPFSRDPQIYTRRGHVWLGGDQALKLSAGYLGLGEAWTFLPVEELAELVLTAGGGGDTRSPPVYVDADPPDFFLRMYPPPGRTPPPFQRFEIRHMMCGWYSGADDRGRRLADIFPGEAAGTGPTFGESSRLHLFGTAEVPSPTLVLGRVRRRYPALSAVLVDDNEDGVPDGMVGILPQLELEFPQGMPVIPARVPGLSGGDIAVDSEAEITWTGMFGDGTYDTFASQIEDRPYMEAYSFLYRSDDGTRSFYPEAPLFSGFVEELTLGDAEAPFYKGRPESLAGEELLEKATWSVLDGAEFAERFVSSGNLLALGAVVEVRSAPGGVLKLSGFEVRRGGAIVLSGPGDIELSGVKFAEGLEQPLILAALQGNVKLARGDETDPMPVSVMAPRGRLEVTGSGPIALEGSLVVDTLDLEALPSGGDIYYDTRLDPTTGSRRERYRVLFSDASIQW